MTSNLLILCQTKHFCCTTCNLQRQYRTLNLILQSYGQQKKSHLFHKKKLEIFRQKGHNGVWTEGTFSRHKFGKNKKKIDSAMQTEYYDPCAKKPSCDKEIQTINIFSIVCKFESSPNLFKYATCCALRKLRKQIYSDHKHKYKRMQK